MQAINLNMLRAYLKNTLKCVSEHTLMYQYIFIFRIHFNKYESEGLFFLSAKTKIVVVKAKELIYTALFVCLGITLILLLIFMFAPEEKSTKTSAGVYTPGSYTSTITLGDNTFMWQFPLMHTILPPLV